MSVTEIQPTEKIEIKDKYLLEARLDNALKSVEWIKRHIKSAQKAAKQDMPYCSFYCWNAFHDTQSLLEHLKMTTNDLIVHGFPED